MSQACAGSESGVATAALSLILRCIEQVEFARTHVDGDVYPTVAPMSHHVFEATPARGIRDRCLAVLAPTLYPMATATVEAAPADSSVLVQVRPT